MAGTAPTAFVSLADDEGNSVTVNVLGIEPRSPSVLKAEIVVETPFVSGRCHLWLTVRVLDGWSDALDRLDAGEDVTWVEDRGASLAVQLTGERDCPEVVVEDESMSMVTVRVPIVLPDDWIADHRRRLREVRERWTPLLSAAP
ncbi:DUF5959 family protein [Streptomyces sp. NPDC003717]|uniref:DUF5959 family protein n=1 Tax=Streptomyces sp. NPDC003717 TaxID=3154276 RepID=UPI0033B56BED